MGPEVLGNRILELLGSIPAFVWSKVPAFTGENAMLVALITFVAFVLESLTTPPPDQNQRAQQATTNSRPHDGDDTRLLERVHALEQEMLAIAETLLVCDARMHNVQVEARRLQERRNDVGTV
ncbi:unnamed protein product [Scytosiphon promiscuus]